MHVRLVHFRCKIHLDLPVLGTDTGLSSNLLHLLTLSLTHVVENGSLEFVSEFDDDSGWAAIGCARMSFVGGRARDVLPALLA